MASDNTPHNGKGHASQFHFVCPQKQWRKSSKNTRPAYTRRNTQTKQQEHLAGRRLVPNGTGRPVRGTVIKHTQRLVGKTGSRTKEAMKGRRDSDCECVSMAPRRHLNTNPPGRHPFRDICAIFPVRKYENLLIIYACAACAG